MSTKHTPGPWHIHDDKGCRWIETSKDDVIARVFKEGTREQFEANSCVLVTAPEMLAALMDAHPHIADDALRARVGNLIAKATGGRHD